VNYLLDTNVVSEWVKPRPNAGVVQWLAEVDEDRTHLSVITLAELRHGIERLPNGARRTRLQHWLAVDLRERFEGRLLAVDADIADACGVIVARGEATGRPIGAMDALLLATARVHGLAVVTRNAQDFVGRGQRIIDPWAETAT